MRRRLAAALAASALATSVMILVAGSGADAATLGDAGWWWRVNPGDRADLPSPAPVVELPETAPAPPAAPHVPEGGLYVARGTDKAVAVAAMRFTLFESEAQPILELEVASGGQTAHEVSILACMTGSAWTGEHGGRWDSKPSAVCDGAGGGSVNGIPSEDGTTWTFPVAPLLIDGPAGKEIDIVLVPAVDPEATGGLQTPFEIAFNEVDGNSLQTTGDAGSADAGDFPEVSDLVPEESPSPAGAGTDFSAPGGTDFSAPVTPEPALDADEQGLTATAPGARNATSPGALVAQVSDGDSARWAAVAVLLAGLAAAWFVSRQPLPALRPLSRVSRTAAPAAVAARPTVGGLGRFARARSGAPPTL